MSHTCIIIASNIINTLCVSPEKFCRHEELIAVEEDPGDVTEDKHKDDADEDEGEVDLTPDGTVCS